MDEKVDVFLETVERNLGHATNAEKIKKNKAVVAFAETFLKVSAGTLLREAGGKHKDTDTSYFFRGMLKYALEREKDDKARAELWGINGSEEEGYFLHPTECLHPDDKSGRPVPVLGDGRGRTLTAMGYDEMRKLAENVRSENLSPLVIAVWKANKNMKRVVFNADDGDGLGGLVGKTAG